MSWIWSECIISGWWEYELVPACLCARLVWVEQCPRPQHEIISPAAQLSSTTVSSSVERGIMCDKILGPDTLNEDMGDFV